MQTRSWAKPPERTVTDTESTAELSRFGPFKGERGTGEPQAGRCPVVIGMV